MSKISKYTLKKHKMTEQDYIQLLYRQGGACKLCGELPVKKRLAIDHNHTTGKVRGLLCHRCNLAMGLLNERIDVITNMRNYLLDNDYNRKGKSWRFP